ncbi:MAG TPA: glycerophosphodiester phosphodiesterase [Chitinivibrionales bacterium]|nr:glycerophosphodiester phosphodiesterase [Chitinivibrionales bacterium]
MAGMQYFGHCGEGEAHSLDSIRNAIACGVDWVYVEVRAENGAAVLCSGNNEAYPSVNKEINQKSLESANPFGGKSPVPLSDVIGRIDGRTGLAIEMQGSWLASQVVREIHQAIFSGKWSHKHFLVCSRNFIELQMIQSYDPHIRVGCIPEGVLHVNVEFAEKIGAFSLHPSRRQLTMELLDDCHQRGIKVVVPDVNAVEDYYLLEAMGVDGVVSRYPEKIMTWRYINNMPDSLLMKS